MSMREILARHPRISAASSGLLLLVGGAVAFITAGGSGGGISYGRVWYTSDDGETFQPGDRGSVPPFTEGGKTWYGCEVVSFDNGKTRQPAYLYRYTPGVRDKVHDLVVNGVRTDPRFESAATVRAWQELDDGGKELKRPDDPTAKWVPAASPAGQAMIGQAARGMQLLP